MAKQKPNSVRISKYGNKTRIWINGQEMTKVVNYSISGGDATILNIAIVVDELQTVNEAAMEPASG